MQVEFTLPRELYKLIWPTVSGILLEPVRWSQVIFPLSAILEKEFLNTYIKNGQSVTHLTRLSHYSFSWSIQLHDGKSLILN